MIPALAAALSGRFTFVMGKGGVGKSTTAAAVALWRADAGEATHLISTDPAHSLGDVLGEPAGAQPRPSRCSARLTVEELDGPAWAARWLARAGEPLAELVERGTYLSGEEVRGFLELAYPGV
ncbi:MAG TPA: ArsA-related P-loop ATPase, partial [Longimicrobiales bacterium]|nr:ArsA-related P-loop ATPase [Longimicrobiales bacterium]